MKKCECNLESVSQSHGSLMNEKFLSFGKTCLELRKKVKIRNVFSLEKLGWNGKTCKLDARSSYLTKTKCALTPKLLSHSPKDKWCKLGS